VPDLTETLPSPAITRPIPGAGQAAYVATIFLSAFLLFQVQLLMGKRLLPWFGGTPALWTTCMLFYQLLLLAGYAYAHVLTRRLGAAGQRRTHLGLLLLSLLLLMALALVWRSPILPSAAWRPRTPDHPVRDVLAVLTVSVGLPFFLLSSTSPLLQKWYAALCPGQSPYRLYAVSNLGSVLGLLTYPSLLETALGLRPQARVWAAGYLLFAAGCVACARAAGNSPVPSGRLAAESSELPPAAEGAAPQWKHYGLWFALPAAASMLLLATTNQISQEVAVIPLLWVIPLSLYLLSFILTFQSDRWYRRGLFHVALVFTIEMSVFAVYNGVWLGSMALEIYIFCLGMFMACLVCHGETARLRPPERHLTAFYLMIAAGGAGGGAFVTLAAPRLFSTFWELNLSIWLVAALVALALLADQDSWIYRCPRWWAPVIVVAAGFAPPVLRKIDWPAMEPGFLLRYSGLVILAALATIYLLRRQTLSSRLNWVQVWVALGLFLLGARLLPAPSYGTGTVVTRARSFYGVVEVQEEQWRGSPPGSSYLLIHGRTHHGLQLRSPQLQQMPTLYFSAISGVGLVLRHPPRSSALRIGVIGLGAGTLAAYARPGDYVRFYEINPDVIRLNTGPAPCFTFIQGSRGLVDIIPGDARLSLEREAERGQGQRFDVLALDAFSSDAIPVHLLNREAFALYLRHLRDARGILALHISNRAVDLEPVVARLANEFGLTGLVVKNGEQDDIVYAARWALLARDPVVFQHPDIARAGRSLRRDPSLPLWTDDYSNLLRVVRRAPESSAGKKADR